MDNEYTRDKVLDYIKEMRDATPEGIKIYWGVVFKNAIFISF